jgi:hypothetical protein
MAFLVKENYKVANAADFPRCISLTNNTMLAGVKKTYEQETEEGISESFLNRSEEERFK